MCFCNGLTPKNWKQKNYFVHRGSQYALQTEALIAPNWQEQAQNLRTAFFTPSRPLVSCRSEPPRKLMSARLQTYKYLCVQKQCRVEVNMIYSSTTTNTQRIVLPEYWPRFENYKRTAKRVDLSLSNSMFAPHSTALVPKPGKPGHFCSELWIGMRTQLLNWTVVPCFRRPKLCLVYCSISVQ